MGRLFHGVHLTEDQAHVLDQFVDLVKETRPDGVLIAGDLFDRAVPPPEAVQLLDDVLSRLVLDLDVTTILIAGNHDSPVRLGFGAGFLARSRLHIRSGIETDADPVILSDDRDAVAVYTLPYAEPALVRERSTPDPESDPHRIMDQHQAMAARLAALDTRNQAHRKIALAHAFVAGGTGSESERPLCVGGISEVQAGLFDCFDLLVAGHLHRPQNLNQGRVHYTGSLLKYSFSEIEDRKTVSLIEIAGEDPLKIERIALTPRRDLRRIKGFLKDLLNEPGNDSNRDDYLLVTLMDNGALLDPMGKLRDVYPNALHIERPFLEMKDGLPQARKPGPHQSELDLFKDFFNEVTRETLSPEQETAFTEIVNAWRAGEREA